VNTVNWFIIRPFFRLLRCSSSCFQSSLSFSIFSVDYFIYIYVDPYSAEIHSSPIRPGGSSLYSITIRILWQGVASYLAILCTLLYRWWSTPPLDMLNDSEDWKHEKEHIKNLKNGCIINQYAVFTGEVQ
jgi:hypothetical protein